MLSQSCSLYFPQWPTVAHICYYLHSLTIILRVQCPNSSVIDTGLKVLSSWFALQASNIQYCDPVHCAACSTVHLLIHTETHTCVHLHLSNLTMLHVSFL